MAARVPRERNQQDLRTESTNDLDALEPEPIPIDTIVEDPVQVMRPLRSIIAKPRESARFVRGLEFISMDMHLGVREISEAACVIEV